MKAVAKTQPDIGISIIDVAKPKPKQDEVLVEVKACGICGTDLEIYKWVPSWFHIERSFPLILGHEFSGIISEVGTKVSNFRVGDRVAVEPGVTCGKCTACATGNINICKSRRSLGIDGGNGALAKYVAVPQLNLYRLPSNIPFEEAAYLEVLAIGVHALEVSRIRVGERIVIVGPGPVGLAILIAAKDYGAGGICVIGAREDANTRLSIAEQFGADVLIVNGEDNTEKRIEEFTEGEGVGLAFDASGNIAAMEKIIGMIRPGGQFVAVGVPTTPLMNMDMMRVVMSEISIQGVRARTVSSWSKSIDLLDKVKIASILGPTLPLDEAERGFQKAFSKEALKVVLIP